MNKEFLVAWSQEQYDWLSWLGMPLLYDGGLCVNRCAEEQEHSAKHRGQLEV